MKGIMPPKIRLDHILVRRQIVESLNQAQGLILAGLVLVDNQMIDKPGTSVLVEASVAIKERPPYVSRGGIKLAAALDTFRLKVNDLVVLDVGASTGGFTDCLLQRQCTHVYALDVGRGQLAHRLRIHPHVTVMEKVNARYPFNLPEQVDLITIDVSFISLLLVLNEPTKHLRSGNFIVALVKPQFEIGKQEVKRGGVVREARLHAQAISKVVLWAIGQGFRIRGVTASPIQGEAGNKEFFVLLQKI